VAGLSYRTNGDLHRTPDRPPLEDMDRLPFVVDVYKRDLEVERYFIGYLLHPYVSLYTGRGCRSKCTFCLWPQTVGGHRYRTRSVEHVVAEIAHAQRLFPQVKEYFFDDDTFTDDRPRAEAIARGLGKLGVTWSCNAKANVPYATLKVLKSMGGAAEPQTNMNQYKGKWSEDRQLLWKALSKGDALTLEVPSQMRPRWASRMSLALAQSSM